MSADSRGPHGDPPISGRGEFTQEFLAFLQRELDNCHQYEGGWKQLAQFLLNCDSLSFAEFERRAAFDATGPRSQTNEVFKEFFKSGVIVDVAVFWSLLFRMGREDLAERMVNFHRDEQLLCDPNRCSIYDEMATGGLCQSLATAPPQEGSDVCSTVGRVDRLTLTANTVIIRPSSPMGGARDRRLSTETTSLGSTSSGSSSSLPRDSDSRDQPKMVNLQTTGSSPSQGMSGCYEVINSRREIVLISYADHDKPKAINIALHLNLHGYEAVLDTGGSVSKRERKRKCKQIFEKACAIVVIYSTFYRKEIMTRSGNDRNTRFIYRLLEGEYDGRHRNQRCVFYPMFQVEPGTRIPRIFNRLPSDTGASLVHKCLFVPVGSASA